MKTKAAYLVIDTHGRYPTISHVRARWPYLEPGQIAIRVAITIPDELVPQIQEVVVEGLASMAIAIEPVAIER